MLSKLFPILLFASLCSSCSNSDVAYVDIYRVHQEFELQKIYADYLKHYKDSAVNSMDNYILSAHIYDTGSLDQLKKGYYEQIQKNIALKTDSLNAIIWKRLNPLIQQYGKENKYKMIFGADGTGHLLYSDSSLDISNRVIEYVNEQYNGM
jgi:Skp family chaperone for outer membrane proteins